LCKFTITPLGITPYEGNNHYSADSGLGFATAKHLLVKDYAVIMACRNLSKANDAKLKLEQETKNQNIIIRQLDLASIQSIRDFVNTTNNAPYGLICNAGIQYSRCSKCVEDQLRT
jgi:NAD(P)-dependent dehydrogenase (short-subunit alcohol dehydrogenase family)